MTKATINKTLQAFAGDDDLDPDLHLGWLASATNPDREVKGTTFLRSWAHHGLDVEWLPEARQPVHIFQSACASVRGRNDNGSKVIIQADEVENLTGRCSYQITRAVWDHGARLIDHQKEMRLQFDKNTGDITVAELADFDPALAALVDDVREHFEANATTVPGQKVRNAVRNTLLRIGAQNLRRKAGGLYFVPGEWRPNGHTARTMPILTGLRGVLEDIYGPDCDFYRWKLGNVEGERDMVRKHFTVNINNEIEKLTLKAIERVRTGKGRGVRQEMLDNLHSDRRKAFMALKQFKELVQVEEDDIEANLADLDTSIERLEALARS